MERINLWKKENKKRINIKLGVVEMHMKFHIQAV